MEWRCKKKMGGEDGEKKRRCNGKGGRKKVRATLTFLLGYGGAGRIFLIKLSKWALCFVA